MNAMGMHQGILSLAIKDNQALYNAYMPFIKNGGIFIQTPKRYTLGEEVFLLLTLPDSTERIPIAGKIIWCTPTGAQGNRVAGIGVQIADNSDGAAARQRIESILAGLLGSDKATHTM